MHNAYDYADAVTVRVIFGLNITRLMAPAYADAVILRVKDPAGYVALDFITVNPGAGNEETKLVQSPPVTNQITVSSALLYDHQPNETVMELTDPTTVTLKVIPPDGVQVAYTYALNEVDRDGLGKYSKTLLVQQEGTWQVRWEGTGLVQTAAQDQFDVKQTAFYP
jgi:hypothetical protein